MDWVLLEGHSYQLARYGWIKNGADEFHQSSHLLRLEVKLGPPKK